MTTNAKGMKPSDHIKEIMERRGSNGENWEDWVNSIISYLDEQHEAKGDV